MYDVLVSHIPIREVIRKREVDVACASIDLAGAEIAMSTQIGRERSLEKALRPVLEDYDFVCIDTPPSLGLLTINALTAADKVIVPVQCEYLSMRGLVQLQNTMSMIRAGAQSRHRDRGNPAHARGQPHRARQGGDRDPRGELRGAGVRHADQENDPFCGGARQGNVGLEIRSGRSGCQCLPGTRQGGPERMASDKRASMREGPLAELFRKTSVDDERAAGRDAGRSARSSPSGRSGPERPREDPQPRSLRREPGRLAAGPERKGAPVRSLRAGHSERPARAPPELLPAA